jgi:2-isopropylmalate synthase
MSRLVWEQLNLQAPLNQPYVGLASFAHKGGVHVSAMQRNERSYEHVPPSSVGNERRVLISEMSGRSNLVAKLSARYPQLADAGELGAILMELQEREHRGYSYEAADGSFGLLVDRKLGLWKPAFALQYYRVHGIGAMNEGPRTVEATVKLEVNGVQSLCAAEGNGPVDALNRALLRALTPSFPVLEHLQLIDYKVRVVNSTDGTAAKVRVLISHRVEHETFTTIGVSENVIEASWQALVDAVECALLRGQRQASPSSDLV